MKPQLTPALIIAAVLALQVYSRFAGAPVVDFTLDDWVFLEKALGGDSVVSAVTKVACEPDRPLGFLFIRLLFLAGGDHPARFALYSMAVNSLFLLVVMLLTWRLARSWLVVLGTGVAFALFPNLTESFSWYTMTGYSPGYILYVLGALLVACYAERGRLPTVLAAGFCYLGGLATYEFGVLLPAAYLILFRRRPPRRLLAMLAVHGGFLLLYLAWRWTNAFGMGAVTVYVSRSVGFSAYYATINAVDIASWWIGRLMAGCLLHGFVGFSHLGAEQRAILGALNVAVAVAIVGLARVLWRQERGVPDPALRDRCLWGLGFAGAWLATTHAISLISWTGGRLNFLPAVGMAMVAGFLLRLLGPRARALQAACILAISVCLVANQGTAENWRESGLLSRRLYVYFRKHHEAWRDRQVVLVDTRALRMVTSTSIVRAPTMDGRLWAYNGEAGLIRGFVPEAMLALIQPGPRPLAVLDTEYGARIADGRLLWHARYDPTRPHTTPMDDVFVVDCFAVGANRPHANTPW